MKVGSHRWRVEGATLTVERERGPREVGQGVLGLLAAGLMVFLGFSEEVESVDLGGGLLVGVVLLGFSLRELLWMWKVVLRRESGRVDSMWGLGVPLVRRRRALATFDRVQLTTSKPGSNRPRVHTVALSGSPPPLKLASGGDEAEARALAEAVARQFGLPLQVDEGRVRALDEPSRPSREVAPEVPRSPPPGSRVRLEAMQDRRVVVLPAVGWMGPLLAPALSSVAMVLGGLALCLYSLWKPPTPSFSSTLLLIVLPCLFLCALGVWIGRRVRSAATSEWRLTVSRRGLEVVGSSPSKPKRIPMQHLREVDVRMCLNESESSQRLMLVIEHEAEADLQLGAGLPREELEWAADCLRAALAEADEARRRERQAG